MGMVGVSESPDECVDDRLGVLSLDRTVGVKNEEEPHGIPLHPPRAVDLRKPVEVKDVRHDTHPPRKHFPEPRCGEFRYGPNLVIAVIYSPPQRIYVLLLPGEIC